MKSLSLDSLYLKLDKHILLAQSYTEIDELPFIIKSCRLKPIELFFGKQTDKLVLYRKWFDEFNNSLEITKQKRLKLTFNNLSLYKNINTDLYYGLSIEKVLKISKLAYLIIGKDEDLYEDYYIISLLGIDNYLRTYQYLYGEWRQISSLSLGIKNLKIIEKNTDIRYFRNFSNKENSPIPCTHSEQWLTYLPASKDFLSLIKKQSEIVFNLFNVIKE